MLFTKQSMGGSPEQASLASQMLVEETYQPTTSAAVGAYVSDAYRGVGTLKADITAANVRTADRIGTPLDSEGYKNSEFFRSGVNHYPGMTEESARVLAEYTDEQEARALTMSKASTAQSVAGIGAAFVTGVFEPKNFAIGIATAAVGGPIISRAVGVKRMMKLEQSLGRYGSRALAGGVEGLVAAGITEPGNRYSANILQQDYTMADSLWNIGLSTVLGAGINTAPAFIKDRWNGRKFRKGELFDVIGDELDTATAQFSQAKRVNVDGVENISEGNLSNKTIAERVSKAEQFVQYLETPEFKSRFEGSKVVDEVGTPKVLYNSLADKKYGSGTYLSTKGESGTSPVYLNLKNPLVIPPEGLAKLYPKVAEKDIAAKVKKEGYDGIVITENGRATNVIAFDDGQVIPAFGGDDLDSIVTRIDQDKALRAKEAVARSQDLNDDTGIDFDAVRDIETYNEGLGNDQQQAKADQLAIEKYEAEIIALREQGLLTEMDEKILEMIDAYNIEDINAAYEAANVCLTRG